VEEIYVQPCGLDVLAYGNPFAEIADVGFTYPADQIADRRAVVDTANPNIGAGMYTTAGDYGQLLLMHLRGGDCDGQQVLSPESVDRLHADRIGAVYGGSTSIGSGYGMGWWIDRSSGWIFDGGAYGADAWLDLDDGYGAWLVVEELAGAQLSHLLRGPLEEVMSSGG
jgi:CubicO group peptidase (beta-lactamase class C family)